MDNLLLSTKIDENVAKWTFQKPITRIKKHNQNEHFPEHTRTCFRNLVRTQAEREYRNAKVQMLTKPINNTGVWAKSQGLRIFMKSAKSL